MTNPDSATRRAAVLAKLRAAEGRWVDGPELTTPEVGGSEGLRRLRELRDDYGHPIDHRRHPDKNRTGWQYRLRILAERSPNYEDGPPVDGAPPAPTFDAGESNRDPDLTETENRLLAAWITWDAQPGNPDRTLDLETYVTVLAIERSSSANWLRTMMAAGRRASLKRADILKETRMKRRYTGVAPDGSIVAVVEGPTWESLSWTPPKGCVWSLEDIEWAEEDIAA